MAGRRKRRAASTSAGEGKRRRRAVRRDPSSDVLAWLVSVKGKRFWQIRYHDEKGKVRQKSSGQTRRREAQRVADELADELALGVQPDETSWTAFCDRYETEKMAGLSPKSLTAWGTVTNAVERIIDPMTIEDLTTSALSTFSAKLREEKKSNASIASYLRTLRAALNWAAEISLIRAAPKIIIPKISKQKMMKGRPITGEEFDRLLEAVKGEVAKPAYVASWKHLLRGLWFSGLRLEEALSLWWDNEDQMHIHKINSRRPMLRIFEEDEKGKQDRLLSITPDFVEFLRKTPEEERSQRVFNPLVRGGRPSWNVSSVGHKISDFGEAAKIKVNANRKTGKVKFASAHDLRRSFGARWAARVMPPILQELMRHESIETTMRYYVGKNAERTSDEVWRAYVTLLRDPPLSEADSEKGEDDVSQVAKER